MDSSVKRLAVEVEDHPIDYAKFEGDIPEGEYGAGHVDIWDDGEWKCLDSDPLKAYASGKISFELKGQRLKGRWTLIKTRSSYGKKKSAKNWLLIKAPEKRTKPVKEFVELTYPSRVLYADQGITKLELADYYEMVKPFMLPHVLHRPLTLVRCPSGQGACFFQKHAKVALGPGVSLLSVREKEKFGVYAQLESAAGLRSLVQHGSLELHVWGSKTERIESPDQLVFDFDPDVSMEWADVIKDIQVLRRFLEERGFHPFLKLSGGKGAHVHVPITPESNWAEVHDFSQSIAKELERRHPSRYTASSLKKDRRGKVYIDYVRNSRGVSYVAPYSTRARERAPVALPIDWDELSAKIKPDQFTLRNVKKRLARLKSDPWLAFYDSAVKLQR